MRSPGPLFIVSSRGPRSNTHTAWPSPVRATTSTADIDLSHFHNYCYAERNRNTHACRVDNRVDARGSHECERGTQKCVRHNVHGPLIDGKAQADRMKAVEKHGPPPGAPDQPASVPTPWVALKDDELLQKRICDLGVRIPGSELEGRVAQLYDELAARGLAFRPACYLGDEWFSPAGVPDIAIPFYLAHPRLKTLEVHQMLQVEGGTLEWCQQLLRHESGHAIDHAYRFSSRDDWRAVFGNPETEYSPETYQPRPYSKSFVRNLPNWYAQAHPDEDFAETFAVWLSFTPEQLREQYRGWKALDKLELVHCLMEEAKNNPPKVKRGRRIYEASRLRKTLARYYTERRKLYAEDFPDFY